MAKSLVKTMKHNYVVFIPKPDAATAVRDLAVAFEHCNERPLHSAMKYRSPRAFLHDYANMGRKVSCRGGGRSERYRSGQASAVKRI